MALFDLIPTSTQPCTYKEGETSRLIALELRRRSDDPKHEPLYRRAAKEAKFRLISETGMVSAHFNVCATMCQTCWACVPLRVAANKFEITRSLHRILNKNSDLSFELIPSEYSPELFNLFDQYERKRHGLAINMNEQRAHFSGLFQTASHFLTARNDDRKLLAASAVDIRAEAMLMDCIFYDVEESRKRSLGKLMFVKSIEAGARNGVEHAYISYWVKDSKKLGYKQYYTGLEAFIDDAWIDFDPDLHTSRTPSAPPLSLNGLDY